MSVQWLRVAPWAAAVVLGLAALGMFAAQQRAAGAASAYATIVEHQQEKMDSTLTAHEQHNAVLEDSLQTLRAGQEKLRARAAAAQQQTQTAVVELRQSLDSAQAAQLDRVVQGYETQLAVMAADTARLHAMNRLLTAQRDTARADVQSLRALNDGLAVALDKAVRAQRSAGLWKAVAVATTIVAGAASAAVALK